MTAQSSIPLKWYVPFAQGDSSRVELPVTTADPTRASQTLGFPPLTMQPPESGGVPPQGEDFNGGLNQVARIAWWVLNGGGWPYDSTFATNSNINGYPNGAKLQSADFRGDWINTADNNQNNPDTNGTNWVPGFQYGVTALTGLTGGTVTPTPAQAAKNSITIAGTLTSALTIVLPNWTKNWTITNSTTGAFVTIVKTAAGSGVTIPQNASPTRVSGDGTNIVQAAENIAAGAGSQAMQFQQATGRLLKTSIYYRTGGGAVNLVTVVNGVVSAPTTTGAGSHVPLANTVVCHVKGQAAGGGGGGSNGVGSGLVSLGTSGGGGGFFEGWYTPATQTITVGAGGTAGPAGGAPGGNGGTGGSTAYGALATANGGGGGLAGVVAGVAPPTLTGNASGGTATGGTVINVAGTPSALGLAVAVGALATSNGGGGQYGGGASGVALNTAGIAATNFGAGGSGAASANTGSSNLAGGRGGDGILIVEEYC